MHGYIAMYASMNLSSTVLDIILCITFIPQFKGSMYGTAHFQLHAREHRIASECLFFSCTLLKLACSITQLACSITPLACLSLLVVTGLLAFTRALTRAACIANTLRVLIARYMFTPVSHMHYLSSSNSPVNVRIGKHIRKCRGLVLLVVGPVKINHLSANYTEFYFR